MTLICAHIFETLPKLQAFVFVTELTVAAQHRLGSGAYRGASVWVKLNSGEVVCLTFSATAKLEVIAISLESRQAEVIPVDIMSRDDLHVLIAQAKLGDRLFKN